MQLRPVNLALAAMIGIGLGVVALLPGLDPLVRSLSEAPRPLMMGALFVRVFGLALVLVAAAAGYNWWLARKQKADAADR